MSLSRDQEGFSLFLTKRVVAWNFVNKLKFKGKLNLKSALRIYERNYWGYLINKLTRIFAGLVRIMGPVPTQELFKCLIQSYPRQQRNEQEYIEQIYDEINKINFDAQIRDVIKKDWEIYKL